MLNGQEGDDQIYGGAGNDTMTGGTGFDFFYYEANGGNDVITDFDPSIAGDILSISISYGVNSFASLMTKAAQVGGDTVITFDANNSITLTGVAMGSLSVLDFQFI